MRSTLVFLLCAAAVGLGITRLGAQATTADPRIDTHVHLIFLAGHQKDGGAGGGAGGGPGGRPGRPGSRPGGGGQGGFGKQDYAAAAASLIEMMDQSKVTKVLVLPPPSSKSSGRTDVGDYRDFLDTIAKYPDRMLMVGGGSHLNSMIHETSADKVTEKTRAEFRRRAEDILAKGARGFGEMAALHLSEAEGHPFEEVSPDHPLFLLLADIAAEHDVAIDLHMDAVAEDMDLPARLSSLGKANPARLKANVAAFERLLSHNAKARIVWQHAGSDPVGGMTPELLRRLLGAHPNLNVGLRTANPRAAPDNPRLTNTPVDAQGKIRPDWLALFTDFADRFVMGSDTFVADDASGKTKKPFEGVWRFPDKLPPEVAKKVAGENAARIYGIK